jgi:hypothetical protein
MPAIQRPDPVGYTAAIIDRLHAARAEQKTQSAIIKEAQAKLDTATDAASAAFRELHEELQRMDLAHSGNYGWDHRVAHFLVGLRGLPV